MVRDAVMAMLVVAVCCGARGAALTPPELEGCRIYKLWQFDRDAEGWRPDHNVGQFKIKNGILSFENTGPDPWIINGELGNPEASDYRFVGIKMRSSVYGSTQVYFGADTSPGPSEKAVAAVSVPGDGKFHVYEIDLSRLKTWSGRVNLLRIDPANGGGEVGAKVDIDWIALYQVPARLTIGRPYGGVNEQGGVFVSVPVTNTGGEKSNPGTTVTVGGETHELDAIGPGETRTLTFRHRPGSADITGYGSLDEKKLFEFTLVSPYDKDSGAREIGTDDSVLTIPAIKPVNRVGLSARRGAGLVRMGVLRPLATLAYRNPGGWVSWVEVSADSTEFIGERKAILRSERAVPGGTATITVTLEAKPGAAGISAKCELATTAPLQVLRFEGPRLLAGEGTFGVSKTHAIFPGLEYLEKDEPSSAVGHIGPKFADRRVPHPYKVTVPVMAVEAEGGVVGLWWDPAAEWATGKKLPCAEFESPNKSQGARSHLMTVFAPSIPDYLDENAECAKLPYTLAPGQTMRVSTSVFARAGETITGVIPIYLAGVGTPKAPPVAHGLDGTIDLCFKAFTESLYSPELKGWKSHFGIGDSVVFRPHFAALILGESLRRGDPSLARKCEIDPTAQIAQYTGTPANWFEAGYLASVDAAVAGQSPDGGFPYAIDDAKRKTVREFAEFAGIDVDTLGDIGSTNAGMTAMGLNGILSAALRTGNDRYIAAGIKGLAKLNSYSVPRGAQIWEVHAHTPDIYAAAIAIDANIAGFHLTGDRAYLDHARRWAYTGLPFVQMWTPPIDPVPSAVMLKDELCEGKNVIFVPPAEFYENTRRSINPGATIPVFGTSFYIVNWFGAPVQWCGLAWANSARRYLRLRNEAVLQQAADLVFASGTQQQVEKGFLAGTYPDAWNLLTNTATMAFIGPDTIVDYAYALKNEMRGGAFDSVGFDFGEERAYLTSLARIDQCTSGDSSLDAFLKLFPGQDVYSCIVRVDRPAHVFVDGRELARTDDLAKSDKCYRYDTADHALHVKYRSLTRTAKLSIKW